MAEQIAQAYVRIRPDLAGFKGELQSQLKGELSGVSTLKLPQTATSQHTRLVGVLGEERVALAATGRAAAAASAAQVAGSSAALASVGKAERGALAASGAFRGMGRSVAFASAAFLGGFGFVAVLRSAIEEATQLETSVSILPVVFGRSAAAAEAFAGSAYHALGLAKSTALEAEVSFGRLFRGLGLLPAQAEQLAEELTKVGAAISLARGQEDPAAANAAIIGGLAGRGAALKRYGIIIDQTTLKGEALRLGLVKTAVDSQKIDVAFQRLIEAQAALHAEQAKTAPDALRVARAQTQITVAHTALTKALQGSEIALSRQERTQAATSLIISQGARYVANYADALDTSAGRQRRFHEGTKELREELGTFLLPAFNRGITAVNHWIASISEGGPHHEEFIRDLRDIQRVTEDAAHALSIAGQVLTALLGPIGGVSGALDVLSQSFGVRRILNFVDALTRARDAIRDFPSVDSAKDIGSLLKDVPKVVSPGYLILSQLWGDKGKKASDETSASIRDASQSIQGSLDKLSLLTISPAVRRSSLREELLNLTRVIESGTEFSVKRSRALTQRLAEVNAELGTVGFGPRVQAKIRSQVLALASVLANATKDIGTAALKNLREDRAQLAEQIAELNQRISDQIKAGAEQLSDAVRAAAQAEHDAILGAKANLNQLGQTLADQITQLTDATGDSTKPTGPLARQLDRLNRLIHEGKATPELIRQAQKVESQLNQQQAAQADKRQRIGRSLADLTDEFNTGKISLARFNREVTELLKREHVTYRSAGRTLGVAFADGFREALKELRAQAREIARTPAGLRRSVSGLESEVISPREVIREQNRNIARIADQNAKQLREEIKDRSKLQIKAAHDDAAIARATGHNIVQAVKNAAGAEGKKNDPAEAVKRAAQGIIGAAEGVRDRTFQALRGDLKVSENVARGQRSTMIRQQRSQITHLSDLEAKSQHGNDLLRQIERHLRKQRGRNTNSRSAAETREAANQNLSL